MQKIKRILIILLFVLLSSRVSVVNASTIKTTEFAKYALQWDGKTNMKYVFGGPGGRYGSMTLEECEKNGDGFDCSAFTSMVYRHFGLEIPAQSSAQYNAAVDRFTDESKAIPGDICWWQGHVAIYIGEGKIMHTNNPDPPTNYPHVSQISGDGANYRFPTYFLRMVTDTSILKPITEDKESDKVINDVKDADPIGSIVTESDLTGMIIKETILEQQQYIALKGKDNLSTNEQNSLALIKESISNGKISLSKIFSIAQSIFGIVLIFYGVLMIVCYIFDYANVYLDFSLLSIISLGRFRVVSEDEIKDGSVKGGFDKKRHVTYLTSGMLFMRSVVVEVIGVVLVSGKVGDLIYAIYIWIGNKFL